MISKEKAAELVRALGGGTVKKEGDPNLDFDLFGHFIEIFGWGNHSKEAGEKSSEFASLCGYMVATNVVLMSPEDQGLVFGNCSVCEDRLEHSPIVRNPVCGMCLIDGVFREGE